MDLDSWNIKIIAGSRMELDGTAQGLYPRKTWYDGIM